MGKPAIHPLLKPYLQQYITGACVLSAIGIGCLVFIIRIGELWLL